MTRPHCRAPSDCRAKGAGHCRSCHMTAMRRDPAARARQAEAVREKWQDPEFRARNAEAVRRAHGGSPADLTAYGRAEYEAACAEGFPHADAMEIALDAERMSA